MDLQEAIGAAENHMKIAVAQVETVLRNAAAHVAATLGVPPNSDPVNTVLEELKKRVGSAAASFKL